MKSEPKSLGFVIYGHKEDKTCCKEFPFYCFVEAITRSGFTIESFHEAVELSILQSLDSSLSLKLCEFENQFIFIPICGRCVIKCVELGKTSFLLWFL